MYRHHTVFTLINLNHSIKFSEFSDTSTSKGLNYISKAKYTKILKSSKKTGSFLELLVLVSCGCIFTPSEILKRLRCGTEHSGNSVLITLL